MANLIGAALQNRHRVKKIYVEDENGQLQEVELASDGKTIVSQRPFNSAGNQKTTKATPQAQTSTPAQANKGSAAPAGSMPGIPTIDPKSVLGSQPQNNPIQDMVDAMQKAGMPIPPALQQMAGGGASLGSNEKKMEPPKRYGMKRDHIDPVFRSRLMSIMTDNKYDRKLRGRKRGRLDMHHLYKGQVGSSNIFTQKIERKGKEYNIVLLVDESGSMSGSNIQEAAEVAVFLAQNFENPNLNINLSVIGFSDNIHTYKRLDEKTIDTDQLRNNLLQLEGWGTDDYSALVEAYKQLKGRDGSNVVLMLTDGGSGRFNDVQKLVHSNADLATTIGIGIGTEAKQIPTNVIAKSIDELKPKILMALKSKIKRGV